MFQVHKELCACEVSPNWERSGLTFQHVLHCKLCVYSVTSIHYLYINFHLAP